MAGQYTTFKCNGIGISLTLKTIPIILGITVKGILYPFQGFAVNNNDYNFIKLSGSSSNGYTDSDILLKVTAYSDACRIGCAHYSGDIVSDDEQIMLHYLLEED